METKRKEIYKELHTKYPNFEWEPKYMILLNIASKFIKYFPVETKFQSEIPQDGALFFLENHLNFYDSLVFDAALKGYNHFVLAGDEPRGTIQGLSFLAKGVIWVNRDDKEEKKLASKTLTEVLASGQNIVECPEGKWCLSQNKILLNISRGTMKNAIEASKFSKVYIVPVLLNYNYLKNTAIVKSANVEVCTPILVDPNMNYLDLHEKISEIMWTTRWLQLEENAKKSRESIRITGTENEYVFKREKESIELWEEKVKKLKNQYKIDWDKEETYEIKSKAQQLQEEMEPYIRPNGEPYIKSYCKRKKI